MGRYLGNGQCGVNSWAIMMLSVMFVSTIVMDCYRSFIYHCKVMYYGKDSLSAWPRPFTDTNDMRYNSNSNNNMDMGTATSNPLTSGHLHPKSESVDII